MKAAKPTLSTIEWRPLRLEIYSSYSKEYKMNTLHLLTKSLRLVATSVYARLYRYVARFQHLKTQRNAFSAVGKISVTNKLILEIIFN
jgi:hypothetical protein